MLSLKSKIYKVEISVEVEKNLFIISAKRFVSWAIRWFVLLPRGSHASAWSLYFRTQHARTCCTHSIMLAHIVLCSRKYLLQHAVKDRHYCCSKAEQCKSTREVFQMVTMHVTLRQGTACFRLLVQPFLLLQAQLVWGTISECKDCVKRARFCLQAQSLHETLASFASVGDHLEMHETDSSLRVHLVWKCTGESSNSEASITIYWWCTRDFIDTIAIHWVVR